MIVRQIIAEGLTVNGIGADSAEREKMVEEALAEVQLPADAWTVSRTNSQAASASASAFARALAVEPKVHRVR